MMNRLLPVTGHQGSSPGGVSPLLGIYLNDHLAAATAGAGRARHMVRSYRGSALAGALEPLAADLAEDRAALLDIMRRLGIPVRQYKVYAGRAAERAGRFKANGRLVRRSPLTPLVEVEALRLGVEGKVAAWRALRELADGGEERLDADLLDGLLERARRQRDALEELRRRQVVTAFREQ